MHSDQQTSEKISAPKYALLSLLDLIYSSVLGCTGVVMLVAFKVTGSLVYLQIASMLCLIASLTMIFISIWGLSYFGFKEIIAEIEVKFGQVLIYTSFFSITIVLLITEIL